MLFPVLPLKLSGNACLTMKNFYISISNALSRLASKAIGQRLLNYEKFLYFN
jgi:hypothetical protein